MSRGVLRVFLGAAPGVGKTHAMLDEAGRRARRGTRVVVVRLHDDGRVGLRELSAGLPSVVTSPSGRPGDGSLPVTAILAADPELAVVDELAGCWSEVELLLEAGIDVLTTLNLGQLVSMRHAVGAITGTFATQTVPDEFLRGADQIELIDSTPEALRRRVAHGDVVRSEQLDVASANTYRYGNLVAVRHLCLQWMADRSYDELDAARRRPERPSGSERSERVVVALAGVGDEPAVLRAASLAKAARAELIGVHVVPPSGGGSLLGGTGRQLLGVWGGQYREVLARDRVGALEAFVRAERASQLVLGASSRSRLRRLVREDTATVLTHRLRGVDVHVVTSTDESLHPVPKPASEAGTVLGRRGAAWVLCLVGLPLLTLVSVRLSTHLDLSTALLGDLAVVLLVSVLGGTRPGLVSSLLGFVLSNYYLTPPVHTFRIARSEDVAALCVFVAVAVVVSVLVHQLGRSVLEANRARFEAGALSLATAALVGGEDPLAELLGQVRSTFGLQAAAICEERDGVTVNVAQLGDFVGAQAKDEAYRFDLSSDGSIVLVVAGAALEPERLVVLRMFADQLRLALDARRLRADAQRAATLSEANALRSSLLQAVSHDLRTPLATIKACSSGLLASDASFSDDDRDALYREIDTAADRLNRMVGDLLDMSRLQAGAIERSNRPAALEDVVAGALASLGKRASAEAVDLDVADSLPLVLIDPGLLERAVANLISNALAWSPPGAAVRVEAAQVGGFVDLRIIDRGPGVRPAERARMFEPFQRLGDRSNDTGVGLGLAIARGFIDAIGATLEAEDTPGGGLTMSILLLTADGSLPT